MFKPDLLRTARNKKGWTRETLAFELRQRGYDKASSRAIAYWEDGLHKPRADVLPLLADTLDVGLDSLFGEKPPEPDPDPPRLYASSSST